MKKLLALTLGLLFVLSVGFILSRQPARSLSSESSFSLGRASWENDLAPALRKASLFDPRAELLAILFSFERGLTPDDLINYYYLFGTEAENRFFAVDPREDFSSGEIELSKLNLPFALKPIATEFIKVWPETALAVANNNGGSDFAQGEFKTDLLLACPEGGVLTWYLTYRQLEKGLFKLAINASSGTILR